MNCVGKKSANRKASRDKGFFSNSKNAIFALLLIAAAVSVYGVVEAAVVSHQGSEIVGQVSSAAYAEDSGLLQGLSAADILEAGGGGGEWQYVGQAYFKSLYDTYWFPVGSLPENVREIVCTVSNRNDSFVGVNYKASEYWGNSSGRVLAELKVVFPDRFQKLTGSKSTGSEDYNSCRGQEEDWRYGTQINFDSKRIEAKRTCDGNATSSSAAYVQCWHR